MTKEERQEYTDLGYDEDQIHEIEEGLNQGIDVSPYKNKEILAICMRQIRQGLADGLPIVPFADPAFDWMQLSEIREGLSSFVDVKKYALPEIPYFKMRQIRKGLEKDVDLTPYLDLEAGVIRQIRKATLSGVNLKDYVREGYDEEQLEQIRIAMEKGIDVSDYVSPLIRGISLHEMFVGLSEHLDISVYAGIKYDWRQMRELRLGLLNQIDVGVYANPYYNWKQMRELREGLISGVDVSEYSSLMYPASVMKARRLHLSKLTYVKKIDEIEGDEKADSSPELLGNVADTEQESDADRDGVVITISPDEMEATISFIRNVEISRRDVLRKLKNLGVTYGIDQMAVDRVLSGRMDMEPVLIAKGKDAVVGEDGYYEFFFQTDVNKNPKILSDGSVDYRHTQWFEEVKREQRIAYYHSPGNGEMGFTVTGRRLLPKKGKELPRLHGKGFVLMEDQKTYRSNMDGMIELHDSEIVITKLLNINDLNNSMANPKFEGTICVHGSVGAGVHIIAGEDVIIDGFVEGAVIEAGRDVILKSGMNGAGEGEIHAGGNVEGKFFEAVRIECDGNIKADYCYNCSIISQGSVTAMGKNGSIVGGSTFAAKEIQARNVGNRNGVLTYIFLGLGEKLKKENKEIEEKIKEDQAELVILQNAYRSFQEKYPPEIRNTMDMFMKIENAIFTKNKMLREEEPVLALVRQKVSETVYAKMNVEGILNDNVYVDINGCKWKSVNLSNVLIKLSSGKVTFYTNEHG